MSVGGGEDVGLMLAATVGTRNDSRGPFTVDVPFIYDSSLRISGSVHISNDATTTFPLLGDRKVGSAYAVRFMRVSIKDLTLRLRQDICMSPFREYFHLYSA